MAGVVGLTFAVIIVGECLRVAYLWLTEERGPAVPAAFPVIVEENVEGKSGAHCNRFSLLWCSRRGELGSPFSNLR